MQASRIGSSLVVAVLGIAVAAVGCRHPQPPADNPDKLTVGKVQGQIEIGMDAASVAEILGSPNIITTDEKRREVWIYDKVSSDSVDTTNSIGGTIIIFGGSSSQSQQTKTQKTLTIIIKYDENKRVRDLAYNYSQF